MSMKKPVRELSDAELTNLMAALEVQRDSLVATIKLAEDFGLNRTVAKLNNQLSELQDIRNRVFTKLEARQIADLLEQESKTTPNPAKEGQP